MEKTSTYFSKFWKKLLDKIFSLKMAFSNKQVSIEDICIG